MSSPEPNLLTPREYLALEQKSETRSEYIARRMVALPRSNMRHGLINGNLFRELSSQLRGRAGQAHAAALRIKVSATEMYAYPDIVALCAKSDDVRIGVHLGCADFDAERGCMRLACSTAELRAELSKEVAVDQAMTHVRSRQGNHAARDVLTSSF